MPLSLPDMIGGGQSAAGAPLYRYDPFLEITGNAAPRVGGLSIWS